MAATSFSFPRPVSPTKPNPHPYAIKTTSTALLSRSNSSPQHPPNHGRNYYVPTSPSPSASPSPTRTAHGHRYSRSLTSDQPRPLPAPPDVPTRQKRADTLPTPPTDVEDPLLTSNPKEWSSLQLASYLSASLRMSDQSALPLPVARDIASFVRAKGITGKNFLRFDEKDLEGYVFVSPQLCIPSDLEDTAKIFLHLTGVRYNTNIGF